MRSDPVRRRALVCALVLPLLATLAPSDAADFSVVTQTPTVKNPLAGCQQCHVDVETKYVKSRHFKEKIACTGCHGPSKGHIADENNQVKPDKLFTPKNTDRLCSNCHECSRRKPASPTSQLSSESKVCTDCHGSHELARVPAQAKPAQPRTK